MLFELLYNSNLYFEVGYLIDFQINNCEINNVYFLLKSVDKYKTPIFQFPLLSRIDTNNRKSISLTFQFLVIPVDSRIPIPIKFCAQTSLKHYIQTILWSMHLYITHIYSHVFRYISNIFKLANLLKNISKKHKNKNINLSIIHH